MKHKKIFIILFIILFVGPLAFHIKERNFKIASGIISKILNNVLENNISLFNQFEFTFSINPALYAQEKQANSKKEIQKTDDADKAVTMARAQEDILYRLMLIVMITWIGISIYIFYLHRKVKNLEKIINEE